MASRVVWKPLSDNYMRVFKGGLRPPARYYELLNIVYHVLKNQTVYSELGCGYMNRGQVPFICLDGCIIYVNVR